MFATILKLTVLALSALALFSVFSVQRFQAETQVEATPEAVWAVLTDTARYGEWNPVFVAVEGHYAVGETLSQTVRFPDGRDVVMQAKVAEVAAPNSLRQRGGLPLLLQFEHHWEITPVAGGIRVSMRETDRGIGVWFWDSSWLEAGYQRTVEALRDRVESGS